MQPKLRLLVMTLSVILLSFVTSISHAQSTATVSTDSLDYHPGSTANIKGSGFQPGETVTLQVIHVGETGDNSISGAHAPWDVIADASGNITATWTVPLDQDELGATLLLTADGKTSLLHAEEYFTDATITISSDINWSAITTGSGPGGLPSSSDAIVVKNGATLTVNVSNGACLSIQLGEKVNTVSPGNNSGNGTLVFNSGSKVMCEGNVVVGESGTSVKAGTLTMTSGGLLQIKGTLTLNTGNSTFNTGSGASGGTIEFNANGLQNIFPATYNNLTLSGSGIKSLTNSTETGGTLTVRAGVTLDLNVLSLGGTTAPTSVVLESGTSTAASITSTSGTLTLGGNVTLNTTGTGATGASISAKLALGAATRSFTIDDGTATSDLTISGVISGTGGLSKDGNGTLTLSGVNTYTGASTIGAGVLSVSTLANGSSNSNIGASASAASNLVLSGGTLQYTGATASANRGFTLTNSTTSSIEVTTAASSLTISGGSASSSGAVVKIGAGTLVLSGVSGHTGTTTVSAGTLSLGGAASGNNTIVGDININGGTLNYSNGNNDQIANTSNITLSSGTFDLGARTETIGSLNMSNAALAKGSGTLTINNASSITGGTVSYSSSTASLTLQNNLTLGAATFNYNSASAGNNNLNLGGDFTYGASNTLPASFINSGAGAGQLQIGSGGITRTFNIAQASLGQPEVQIGWTLSGGTGTNSFTKSGTGSLLLTNSFSYTGATTISAGELRLNPIADITPNSPIKLDGGKLSTVNIASGRTINDGSTLNLNSNSTIDLGSNAHALKFANSSSVSWAGFTLTINNWSGTPGSSGTGGKLFIGTDATGLANAQLNKIQFNISSITYPATILSTGEVVPKGNSITTGTISGSPFCAGTASISVPFTYSTAAAFSGATFTAQLSDASGSFTSPTNLQTVSSDGSGSQSISITIPSATANGTGYRIRIVSNTPPVNGSDNGANITINAIPALSATSSSTAAVCSGTNATITLSGLLASTPHSISYTIGGTAETQTATATSNALGVATFNTIALTTANSGQTITITGLSRTDVTPGCSFTPAANNTATLPTVNPNLTPSVSLAQTAGSNPTCSGSTVTFTATASNTSTGTVTYTFKDGTSTLQSSSSNTYTTTSLGAGTHSITVDISVSGGCLTTTTASSDAISITENAAPTISSQPTNVTTTYGNGDVSFTVTASGTPAPTYQWQVNTGSGFGDISGATSATLTVSNPTVAMSSYQYHVVITNSCSSVTSNDVTLTVSKKTLTITATGPLKTYGTALTTTTGNTFTTNGNEVVGQSVTSVTLTPDAAGLSATTAAGSAYTVTPSLATGTGGFLESNYDINYVAYSGTVSKKTLTITAKDISVQYSDVPRWDTTITGFVLGDDVSSISGSPLFSTTAPTAPNGAILSAPGTTWPISLSLGSLTSSNYTFILKSGTLTVTKEDARVTYTGAMLASTSSTSSTTATVTLAATVQDISATADAAGDTNPGDIRNARVKFVNRDNNADLTGWLAPGLVDLNDLKTGTVTANVPLSCSSTTGGTPYNIGIVVDNGYYIRNSQSDDQVVVVAQPLNDFIVGGGYEILQFAKGLINPQNGTKNNFGFNVKWNKSGTNLQGNINTIVQGADGHIYQVKGNSMTSMSIKPASGTPATATFNGKASIQDITDPNNVLPVDGGATLQVTMTDMGDPSGNNGTCYDKISITVWNKNGGLWFSSNWNGTQTIEQQIAKGNLKVNSSNSNITGTLQTTMNLTSSLPSVSVNQSVIFTAKVVGSSTSKPSGNVIFVDYTTNATLGTVALNSSTGVATLTTAFTTAGVHNIVAYYSGDSKYSSNSTGLTQTVNDPTSTSLRSRVVDNATATLATVFNASASPNPTQTQFNVKLESSNTRDEIRIIVYGINGKPVETRQHLTAGQTIQLGANYRPGMYVLEMIQGDQRKQLKLLKLSD